MEDNERIAKYRQDIKGELLKIEFAEGHYTEAEADEAINSFSDDDLIQHLETNSSAAEVAKFISQYF